jgi:hypothetical protein
VDVLLSALLAAQKKNDRQPQAPLLSAWIVATQNYIHSNLKAIKKRKYINICFIDFILFDSLCAFLLNKICAEIP